MEFGADLFDGLIGAVGPGAVGEQGDGELAFGIDPERSAGVAEVAVGGWAEIFSGLRWGGWSVPSESAGSAGGCGFAAGEEGDGLGAEDGTCAEHGLGKSCDIFGGGEQAGVSSDTAEDESIFVLDFALDDAMAERAIVDGGRNFRAHLGGRVERRAGHGERAENFALAEGVEGFLCDASEGFAEDDESDVAVFGLGSGIGGEWHSDGGAEQIIVGLGFEEKFLVGRKSGGVSEKLAEGDVAATGIEVAAGVCEKFGDGSGYGGVEFEKAALVEDGGHRSRGDDLGDRGQVEEGGGGDFGIPTSRRIGETWGIPIFFIDELAERFEGYQAAAVCDGYRGGRKGVRGDRVVENGEGRAEDAVLIVEGRHLRIGRGSVQGLSLGNHLI